MLHQRRKTVILGLALSLIGLRTSAQETKKENTGASAVDKALEQSKLTGMLILAVGGRET